MLANHGKILKGESFGKSSPMKQMMWKDLANLLTNLQLFHCTHRYWRGESNTVCQINQNFLTPNFYHMQYTTELEPQMFLL